MVVIIVLLKFMAYDFNRSIREKAILESNPDVGSCNVNAKFYGQVQEILVLIASASSKCSGESAHMRRLTRAFAASIT